MKSITTGIRLEPTLRNNFKDTCRINKIRMSTALRIMVTLFLSDDTFRDKVIHEANRI